MGEHDLDSYWLARFEGFGSDEEISTLEGGVLQSPGSHGVDKLTDNLMNFVMVLVSRFIFILQYIFHWDNALDSLFCVFIV